MIWYFNLPGEQRLFNRELLEDHSRVRFRVPVGAVVEFSMLNAEIFSHIVHLHVNHFQVIIIIF